MRSNIISLILFGLHGIDGFKFAGRRNMKASTLALSVPTRRLSLKGFKGLVTFDLDTLSPEQAVLDAAASAVAAKIGKKVSPLKVNKSQHDFLFRNIDEKKKTVDNQSVLQQVAKAMADIQDAVPIELSSSSLRLAAYRQLLYDEVDNERAEQALNETVANPPRTCPHPHPSLFDF